MGRYRYIENKEFDITPSESFEDVVKRVCTVGPNMPIYVIPISDIVYFDAAYDARALLDYTYYGTGDDMYYKLSEVLKDKENYRLTDQVKDFAISVMTKSYMWYRIDVGRWMYPVPVECILGSPYNVDVPRYDIIKYNPEKHGCHGYIPRVTRNEHTRLISLYYPEDGYAKITATDGYVWLEAQNNDKEHPHLNETFIIQLDKYYLNYLRDVFYSNGYWDPREYRVWSWDNLQVNRHYYTKLPEERKFGINPILIDQPGHYLDPWLKGSKYSYVNGIPEEEQKRIEKETLAQYKQFCKDREVAITNILKTATRENPGYGGYYR